MRYNKPAISIADQIQLLETRGLFINDRTDAEHFLSQVSYYRLAAYWWPLQSDTIQHEFKIGADFDTVIQYYNFDRELRLIVFNMIERIEIGIRTQLIYHLSFNRQDPWWFEKVAYFKDPQHWQDHLKAIKDEVKRSKEVFIENHNRKYGNDSRCPPSWKSLEIVSLGLLSKMYRNIRDSVPEKKKIAHNLRTKHPSILGSWLMAITVVRNICAHHSRLWNRSLTWPMMPNQLPLPWVDVTAVPPKKLYATICCMQYLLQSISPENRFRLRFEHLFADYPNINIQTMGFTPDWNQQPLWQ